MGFTKNLNVNPLLFRAGGLLFCLLLTTKASAEVPSLEQTKYQARLRLGQNRDAVAAARLKTAVQHYPEDAELHGMLGHAFAGLGQYAEALDELELGVGTAYYELRAINAHADTLRWVGAPNEAAELRRSMLVSLTDEPSIRVAMVKLIDDHRLTGDLNLAYEACLELIAIAPDRSGPWAQLAQVHMDLGQLQEAATAVGLAEDLAPPSIYTQMAAMRLDLMTDKLASASERATQAKRQARLNPEVIAAAAEVRVANTKPQVALDLLERHQTDKGGHPLMMLAQIKALQQLGLYGEARVVLDDLRIYQSNPRIRAAIVDLATTP